MENKNPFSKQIQNLDDPTHQRNLNHLLAQNKEELSPQAQRDQEVLAKRHFQLLEMRSQFAPGDYIFPAPSSLFLRKFAPLVDRPFYSRQEGAAKEKLLLALFHTQNEVKLSEEELRFRNRAEAQMTRFKVMTLWGSFVLFSGIQFRVRNRSRPLLADLCLLYGSRWFYEVGKTLGAIRGEMCGRSEMDLTFEELVERRVNTSYDFEVNLDESSLKEWKRELYRRTGNQ